MALGKLKVRRIEVNGKLAPGVYAKDVILHIIRKLGVNGGTGYAYEYAGEVFDQFSMEERMTVCNMSIEEELVSVMLILMILPSNISRGDPMPQRSGLGQCSKNLAFFCI